MNIIITGAGKGIGFECAKIFARNASNNVIAISRNINQLNSLKAIFNDPWDYNNLIPISFDLENDNYNCIIDEVQRLKEIHILINNAGLLINKPFEQISDEEWKKVFAVNVFAPVKLTRHLLSYMGKTARAHVVNISSMGGFQGSVKFPGLTAYSASKSAIVNLSEVLAVELESKNISVNCLSLGAVQTEMLAEAFP